MSHIELDIDGKLRRDPVIKVVADVGQELNIKIYLVGGPVRDLLLGKDILDYDFVVIGDLRKLSVRIEKRLGAKVKRFSQFMTVSMLFHDIEIDFAHARYETYEYPGALPSVRPCYSIEEDLGRRDFTINAMAISLVPHEFGTLIDVFGGLNDLKDGVVRVLHRNSFVDDPTRSFRAVRYAKRLNFKYSEETLDEFPRAVRYMGNVSFQRIKNELMRTALERNRALMFIDISRFRLIYGLKADTDAIMRLNNLLKCCKKEDWLAFYLLFLAGCEMEIHRKTSQLTKEERRGILLFKKALQMPSHIGLDEIHDLLREAPQAVLAAMAALKGGIWKDYLNRRRFSKPELSGRELINMGVKRGPDVRNLLYLLETERLYGRISSQDAEIDFVKKWLEHKM